MKKKRKKENSKDRPGQQISQQRGLLGFSELREIKAFGGEDRGSADELHAVCVHPCRSKTMAYPLLSVFEFSACVIICDCFVRGCRAYITWLSAVRFQDKHHP